VAQLTTEEMAEFLESMKSQLNDMNSALGLTDGK
jgi:hypothetical protein